jgi:hypothetical protein
MGKAKKLQVLAVVFLFLATSGNLQARGPGIAAGDGRLHPALKLDLVFDSNPGYFAENPVMDLMLRIRPGLSLALPSPTVAFELNSSVGYDYYFGVDNSRTSDLSTFAGEADLRLGLNPEGQVSFFLEDNFSRSGDPRYTSLAGKFDRTDNEAKARLQIKPGGGALTFDLAYGFFLDRFDSSADSDALSNYAHRAYFSAKWKFLPKTALVVDFDADIRRYLGEYSNNVRNMDVNAIRATAGMLGQITPSMALTIKAGYGDSLLPSRTGYTGSNYRSAIGQAELSYRRATTFLQLGYLRNFQPVVLFAWFGQDRAYARFRQQLAGRFELGLDVAYDYLSYGTAVIDEVRNQGGRTDHFISAGASFDVFILEWLQAGLSYNLQARLSDWVQPQTGNPGVEYTKHLVVLHFALDY